ncbi:MAG: hypothetical protein JEY71_12335 [Sphaerochaeta sp.]|nr:hypothetical protein [Sphaerochaeta sp.]
MNERYQYPRVCSLLGVTKTPLLSAQALYYLGVSEERKGVNGKSFNFTTEEIPAPHALDPIVAEKLWHTSLEMGGLQGDTNTMSI